MHLPDDLPGPSFVIDLEALRRNARILDEVRRAASCRIVLALKGFAMWSVFPELRPFLDGCCASGLWEARLAREEFGGHVLAYSPAYRPGEVEALLPLVDHLDFNSLTQWEAHRALATNHPRFQDGSLRCGLRINPEHSTAAVALYDPCAPGSRLGVRAADLPPTPPEGISGLHFHTLCEQGTDALEETLDAVEGKFGHWLDHPAITWLNMGGGHWITKPDYDRSKLIDLVRSTRDRYGVKVWLEPGEAAAIHTGVLVATVLDVVPGSRPVAVLDVSATAHMPDVLEMPYRPEVTGPDGKAAREPGATPHTTTLAGPTCLAGDVIGDYAFSRPLSAGDRLVFEDMAHYTMVKTTFFNGVPHPALVLHDSATGETRVVREFSYEDFRSRLS